MNMRKNKVFCFIFISLILICTYADASKIGDYYGSEREGINLSNVSGTIYGTLIWIGYAAAACVVFITGIQYLIASPQKKAQLKDKLWLIVLGVIMLAGGFPLLQLIADGMSKIGNTLLL